MHSEPDLIGPVAQFPIHNYETTHDINLPPFAIYPLGSNRERTQAAFPHRHDFYQILLVVEGEGTHVIDGCPYLIEAPVLYLLTPRHVHFWSSGTVVNGYGMLFKPDFLMLDTLDREGIGTLSFLRTVEQQPLLRLDRFQSSRFEVMIREMEHEALEHAPYYLSVLSAYWHILIIHIQRLAAISQRLAASPVVQAFQDLVYEHFATEHSITFYAERIGVSSGYLADLIRETMGITPGQFIRQMLVQEAKRLLINTNLTVEQISYQLSFQDPAYFGRLFRREVETSPGRFRDEIRKKYQMISP
jgi:AraC family transcriptional activator of pobA